MDTISQLQREGFPVFKKLYDDYHYRIYNYVYAKTGSEYLAEEVVQVTFIKIWEKRMQLSTELSVAPQIFRIANTTLIDLIRKLEKKIDLSVLGDVSLTYRSEEVLPRLFLKETQKKLDILIDAMPPIRSKVFRMSRFDEMSHKEIAHKLSISPRTVENHIALAIKYIKPFFMQMLGLFFVIQFIF